ncbi:tRNA preQ1(34) S-adenosylmethionine ribosyltransferase-isomerase QueA [Entomobacter blattae]|uniref:S-adenosylmethionine:tRNA ribosyltransferase-isomerase n=1 Tax=Entomobacter blattae TaxID=2762277 RepID=A0A7H1NR12_9PROT|nr:tRNA preQ1(34) S-adenosylmethionine ribosyltransferase-isomerase QueA [Entomobacter blattae]QNT78222.1 S-adenosylmethionine:tRNA ribosyltransferase-isomerase [Entomobacter blattae]
MPLSISDFDFPLPASCVAQHPATPRDSARLLCVQPHVPFRQTHMNALAEELQAGDVLVVNNTKVIPAQLEALKNTTRIGITLDRPLPAGLTDPPHPLYPPEPEPPSHHASGQSPLGQPPLPERPYGQTYGQTHGGQKLAEPFASASGTKTQNPKAASAPLIPQDKESPQDKENPTAQNIKERPILSHPNGEGWPEECWHVLFRKAKRLKVGDILHFSGHPGTVHILHLEQGGAGIVHFDTKGDSFDDFLNTVGQLALPPYITRPNGPTEQDNAQYHTMFSRYKGAIAAPTAGLHFTPELMNKLEQKGIICKAVTLHVGPGTFLPIRGDDLTHHIMHAENGMLDSETAAYLNAARNEGRRIVAVGTTTLRLLESAVDEQGQLQPFAADTRIFIKPGYQFRVVDILLTNFHLPRSTLFMLVCAFSGVQTMQQAYAYAIEQGFRFYSYGDACLLYRTPKKDTP